MAPRGKIDHVGATRSMKPTSQSSTSVAVQRIARQPMNEKNAQNGTPTANHKRVLSIRENRAGGWLKENDSPREYDEQQRQHLCGTAHVLGLL